MRLLALALLASLALAAVARADTFESKCPDIAPCARAVGDLLGQKYVFDNDLKGPYHGTQNLELTKDNAELLFTNMLNNAGYARVPTGEQGTYQIQRQRAARDGPLPMIDCTQDHEPPLPNTWDLVTMRYKATHKEIVEDIARTSRSFMPANSRIIPYEGAGMLLITDTAMNLKKLYAIIKDLDIPFTPQMRAKREHDMREARERAKKAQAEANAPKKKD